MSEKLKQDHYKVKVEDQEENSQYLQGRGAQINTKNKFLKNEKTKEHVEAIDDWEETNVATQYLEQESKTIVNKVDSPDVGMMYSMNPYAGCEHGCIYCYARNVHEYWGYSAGLDFERKIIVKKKRTTTFKEIFNASKMGCNTDHVEWKHRLLPTSGANFSINKRFAESV